MTKEDGTDPNEERIQKLESENSELKNQLKVKDDINQMNEGKINSLEMDGDVKDVKIEKFQWIFMNMTAEIERLKN